MLPCWDWLFGTSYLPDELPKDYGIDDPLPQGVLGQLIHPFLAPASSAGDGAARRPPVAAPPTLGEEREQQA